MSSAATYDFIVVGAGIVGLTVAGELKKRYPDCKIAILEKEERAGMHASGRNSGVMHCGIYYGSGTLKAKVCSQGAKQMVAYAREEGIACNQGGKVIIATSQEQLPMVEKLLKNASDNNIEARKIDNKELHEIEPYAAEAVAAIYCPTTAVIDGVAVLKRLQEQLEAGGVVFHFNCQVTGREEANAIVTTSGNFAYGFLYNCAGAYADRIARMFALAGEYTFVPFKGIYWKLSEQANPKVRSNIYPVPDISLPFLGVHLTRVISGDVYIGPTAIPAFGRENYGKLEGIKLGEGSEILLKLAEMYLRNENNFRRMVHMEMAKYSKENFLAVARKLMPSLKSSDMVPTSKAGIRPQLVNTKTRKLEMDYIFERTENSLHVLNAISPAFTSSFAFAELIVDQANV